MGATGLLKVKNRGLIVTESVPTADSDLTALPICWDWAATFDALQAQSTTARVSLSQVVVLVPFAQVMWAAKRAWLASRGDGPMPRFVTTSEWARSYGGADTTGHDVLMSPGLDQATALSLLEQLDLPRLEPHWLDHLAQQVVVAVHSLASVSAAQPPGRRSEWAADLLLQLNADGGGVARLDAVVKQLAVVWAGQSSWETDVLWDARVLDDSPLLCHIPGWSSDPLAQALLAHWAGQKMTGVLPTPVHQRTQLRTRWLPCVDGQDEALEAAAAVIRHVNDSTRQVGLVALDRGMVRRIVRMLELQGVSVREGGLVEELLRVYQVHLAGPTTLAALLTSFRVGFQSIAIEQRAGEIRDLLGVVRMEFRKFNEVIDKVEKNMLTATKALEDGRRRTRVMERSLKQIEMPDATRAAQLLAPEIEEEPSETD